METSRLKAMRDPLLPAPTDAEKAVQLKPAGWKCVTFIIGNEAFEKAASYGLTANLMVYLMGHYNMEQVFAVKVANVFSGTTNLTPLLGAFVSDAYWGRFRTLTCGSLVSLMGMVALTLTSLVPLLRPPSCDQVGLQVRECTGPTNTQLGFLFFSMVLLAFGAGGVRPCSLPFGVDQFDCTTEQGRSDLNSFFNWYYCISSAATLLAMTVIVYIQDSISWPLGFGISTSMMLLSIIFFLLGTGLYVYVAPDGSVFSGIVQVFVAAYRKRNLKLPSLDDPEKEGTLLYDPMITITRTTKLPLGEQFRFLNKAAIICQDELSADNSPANPWRLCSAQQIEEVKCLFRIIPIWASGIICFLAMSQQWSFAVLQSLTMDQHLGPNFHIPAGSMWTIGLITIILFMPIYDRLFVPMMRRVTKLESGITLLQRQGVGLVISFISMVVAAMVEKKRRDSALSHGGVSPMSSLWLTPQLALMGIAEAFNAVGQVEFYNRQFPEHMQTLASSLFCCGQAGASYLGTILVAIIQKSTGGDGQTSWLDDDINVGRLDYFYYLLAGLSVLNLLYFFLCAHYYRCMGMKGDDKSCDTTLDGVM